MPGSPNVATDSGVRGSFAACGAEGLCPSREFPHFFRGGKAHRPECLCYPWNSHSWLFTRKHLASSWKNVETQEGSHKGRPYETIFSPLRSVSAACELYYVRFYQLPSGHGFSGGEKALTHPDKSGSPLSLRPAARRLCSKSAPFALCFGPQGGRGPEIKIPALSKGRGWRA